MKAVPIVADDPRRLQERSLRSLQRQIEALEAQEARAKGYQPKLASQAANLGRAAAALTAEMRKGDEDCLAQVDAMGLPELLGIMKTWLTRCPKMIRDDLRAWLDEPKENR